MSNATMTGVATHHEYRIETMAPDDEGWHYRHVVGFAGRELDAVRQRLADAISESADGWRYRLTMRVVSVMTTAWIEHGYPNPKRGTTNDLLHPHASHDAPV